jgi:hypothetical protein
VRIHGDRRGIAVLCTALVVMLLALGLVGCGSGAGDGAASSTATSRRFGIEQESWWKPWTWRNDEDVQKMQKHIEDTRTALQKGMAAPLFVMACVAVLMAVHGTTWAERLRGWFTWRFSVHPLTQRRLATFGFVLFVIAAVIYSTGSDLPGWTPLPIVILCGGASVIFFSRLRPVIGTNDAVKRKLAFAQLKTLLFLVLVVLAAMTLLSGDLLTLGTL